jgi:hypothetical protein
VVAHASGLYVRAIGNVLRGHAGDGRKPQAGELGCLSENTSIDIPAKSLAVVHTDYQDSFRRRLFSGQAAKHLQRDDARRVRIQYEIGWDNASGTVVYTWACGAQVGNNDAFPLGK